MKPTDKDFAAFMARLPVLRRHEDLVRARLHQFAMRRSGVRGDTLSRLVLYFSHNVQDVGPANRAFLKRTVVFADLIMDGANPEAAARVACRDHPDPYVDLDGDTGTRQAEHDADRNRRSRFMTIQVLSWGLRP